MNNGNGLRVLQENHGRLDCVYAFQSLNVRTGVGNPLMLHVAGDRFLVFVEIAGPNARA